MAQHRRESRTAEPGRGLAAVEEAETRVIGTRVSGSSNPGSFVFTSEPRAIERAPAERLLRDPPRLGAPIIFSCRKQIQQPPVCGLGLCQSQPHRGFQPPIYFCQHPGKISVRQAEVLAAFPAPLPKDPRCLHQPSLSRLMCCFISSVQALCNSLQLGRPILHRLSQSVPGFDQKHHWHPPPPWLPILRV